MQKLYIPWSLKARFTTGKIYFLGAKPYLLKTSVWQGCPLRILKMWIFACGNVDTWSQFCSYEARRCWMLLVPSDVCDHFWASPLVSVFWLLPVSVPLSLQGLAAGATAESAKRVAFCQQGLVQKRKSPASSPEKAQTPRCGFDSRASSSDQAEAGALLKTTPSLSSPPSAACLRQSSTCFFGKSFLHILRAWELSHSVVSNSLWPSGL